MKLKARYLLSKNQRDLKVFDIGTYFASSPILPSSSYGLGYECYMLIDIPTDYAYEKRSTFCSTYQKLPLLLETVNDVDTQMSLRISTAGSKTKPYLFVPNCASLATLRTSCGSMDVSFPDSKKPGCGKSLLTSVMYVFILRLDLLLTLGRANTGTSVHTRCGGYTYGSEARQCIRNGRRSL
jgi:hypothetical protein